MSDKVTALVTGASRGIGASVANALVADGFYVVGSATSAKGAEQITEALGANGMGIELKLQDSESIAQAFAQIKEQVAMPLVLVNNAGITKDNLLLRMSDAEWDDVIDTNLNGAFRVTKPILRGMLKARWGRVINMGSVVGRMGNPGQGNYVASKAGLRLYALACP
jgi:3-oxoacyl-[acyl-carrier protein] reductase